VVGVCCANLNLLDHEWGLVVLNRRQFLNCAGTTGAILGTTALGMDYLLTQRNVPPGSTTAANRTLPSIKGFFMESDQSRQWQGIRGVISFMAEDPDSPIAEAQLRLDAFYPSEIPGRAVPPETSRSYGFTGSSKSESFSQTIADLKGGKGYLASARARDISGNESSQLLDIPYVREFENNPILYSLNVGAHYYPWYGEPSDWSAIVKSPKAHRF